VIALVCILCMLVLMWICGIYTATYNHITKCDIATAYKIYSQSKLPFVKWSDKIALLTGIISLMIGAGFLDYMSW
jgi:hypothetical protein